MTLDEAILHARSKAECGGECAAEHAQLAEWLEELRELKAGRTCKREKHGMKMNGSWKMRCSECGYGIGDMRWSYCPNCGCKVVGE